MMKKVGYFEMVEGHLRGKVIGGTFATGERRRGSHVYTEHELPCGCEIDLHIHDGYGISDGVVPDDYITVEECPRHTSAGEAAAYLCRILQLALSSGVPEDFAIGVSTDYSSFRELESTTSHS